MSDSHAMPGSKVGVVNCGISSIKYEVFDRRERPITATGLVERIGSAEGRMRQNRRGIALDEERNGGVPGKATELQEEGAPVRVLVVRTDEELEIALQAEAVMEMKVKGGTP